MKTLICTQPGKLNYGTAEEPVTKPGFAIIRIRRIGVCGTDLHAFEGTQPYFTYPRILGHELSGELVDTGAQMILALARLLLLYLTTTAGIV